MEIEKNTEKETSKQRNTVGTSVVLAAIIIAGAIMFSSLRKNNLQEAENLGGSVPIPSVTENDFIYGNPNASITLVEYGDFSCSFCARYHPTMKKIVNDYKGEVRWVYRHLPIFNKPAAISAQCVGNLIGDDAFFAYADSLYQNQQDLNQDFYKKEAIALGLDEESYNKCINNKEVGDKISRDFSVARILAGFNATPYTVLIDGKGNMYPFSGALSYEDISSLIDSFIN